MNDPNEPAESQAAKERRQRTGETQDVISDSAERSRKLREDQRMLDGERETPTHIAAHRDVPKRDQDPPSFSKVHPAADAYATELDDE